MFVLIAGFLVSRGGASCQVELVLLVSICVNVLAVGFSSILHDKHRVRSKFTYDED